MTAMLESERRINARCRRKKPEKSVPISFEREEIEMQLTAVFMQVPEGCIAFVEELPGANTQGDTLEEARENLREAVELVLEANRELVEKSLGGQTVIRESFTLVVP